MKKNYLFPIHIILSCVLNSSLIFSQSYKENATIQKVKKEAYAQVDEKKLSHDKMIHQLGQKLNHTYTPSSFRNLITQLTVFALSPDVSHHHHDQISKPLQLVMGTDEFYVEPTTVVILSAMLSANPTTSYDFHILYPKDSPLSSKSQEKIKKLVAHFDVKRFHVFFYPFDPKIIPQRISSIKRKSWPDLIMAKMFFTETFKDKDRILWLDSDLIIKKDLSTLYNHPMNNQWLIGVEDLTRYENLTRLNLDPNGQYINAGVVVYNLQEMRHHRVIDKINAYFNAVLLPFLKKIDYPEQDLFALLFQNKIIQLGKQGTRTREDGKKQYQSSYPVGTAQWNYYYQRCEQVLTKNFFSLEFGILHLAGVPNHKPWKSKTSRIWWLFWPRMNDGVHNMYWALTNLVDRIIIN